MRFLPAPRPYSVPVAIYGKPGREADLSAAAVEIKDESKDPGCSSCAAMGWCGGVLLYWRGYPADLAYNKSLEPFSEKLPWHRQETRKKGRVIGQD
jgi:hypothetical protein